MVDETPKQEARRRIEQAARTGATELVLGGLRLTSVPPEITTLENLWYLDLRGNRLTTLPPEIPQLQNLRQLSLSYNQLTVLSPEIGMLQNLRELHLESNQLNSLPPEIGMLQNLRELHLESNQLNSLPPEIGMLQNLRELHLESNQLNSLPPEIGQLQKLQTLDLSHNPLPEPYPELIERGTDAVLNYLRSLATESTVLYEAKLLLVGEGNVGKTSLVEAMAVKPAKRKEVFKANRSTTHGISLGQLKLDHPGGDAAKRITMNTWDFGGQDVYRITHQFFFSKRSLYLLVWWPREGQEAGGVKGWLDRIRLRVPDARVILVSTHADEPRPPEIDYRELEGAFPGMLAGRHAIDSKSGTGVDDLLATIAAEGAKLPQMGEKMSRHWIETRDKVLLIESPKSRAHFAAIANQHELDESATETLLNLLHDLGRIVYYGGDEGLCDSVVIKPEWLTKAIGYVLEDRATREAKGELQHSRLREIWYEHKEPTFERYAPASHPFFLRLMEKFDISYRLPEENASLVGQLVPYEQPELPWLEDSTLREGVRELCLFFSLNEEAPGLIPWLLVRNHRFSKGLHWRRGAFLAHRGHDALMNEAHTAYGVVTHRAGPFP